VSEDVRPAARAPRRAPTIRLCLVASVTAAALIASAILPAGIEPVAVATAARRTARLAFLLFLLVYVTRPWMQLAPGRAAAFCLRNRRSLGLAYASVHLVHLGPALAVFVLKGELPPPLVLGGGGSAILFLVALAATSNDSAVRALGLRRWRRLHRTGIHALWIVFVLDYAGKIARAPVLYGALFALALAAGGVRHVAWRRTWRGSRVPDLAHA